MSFDFKRALKFEHNVGAKEKQYRLYGGAALIVVSVFTAEITLLLVGLILVGTGFTGFCPAYAGMGKNTCDASAAPAEDSSAS